MGRDSDSGSETSDGQGGRIKRKFKLPSGDIGISGGFKGPKGDADSSGSETSDGHGGRIKRKLKIPSAGVSGGANMNLDMSSKDKGDISDDDHKKKFKLPKFKLVVTKIKEVQEKKF